MTAGPAEIEIHDVSSKVIPMILDDLLDSLDANVPVDKIVIGAYWCAVVSRSCGLSSAFREPCPAHHRFPVRKAGDLLPAGGRDLANLATSDRLLEAAVGMAAINSLLSPDLSSAVERNAGDLIAERGAGKNVAIVGNFPFVPRVAETARELWVFERPADPDRHQLDEAKMPEVLPMADIAGITGTSLINHTLDGILTMLRPDCFTVLIGPTTPLSPLLFDHGVDVLAGSVVTDPEKTLACVSQGAIFRQMQGVSHVTLEKEA